jgi:hypothetical protein
VTAGPSRFAINAMSCSGSTCRHHSAPDSSRQSHGGAKVAASDHSLIVSAVNTSATAPTPLSISLIGILVRLFRPELHCMRPVLAEHQGLMPDGPEYGRYPFSDHCGTAVLVA